MIEDVINELVNEEIHMITKAIVSVENRGIRFPVLIDKAFLMHKKRIFHGFRGNPTGVSTSLNKLLWNSYKIKEPGAFHDDRPWSLDRHRHS